MKYKESTLFLLLKKAYRYKFLFFSILITSFIFSFLASYRIQFIREAIDGPISNKELKGLTRISYIIFFILLLEVFLGFILKYSSEILAQKIILKLRKEFLDKLIYFNQKFFSKHSPGLMVSYFVTDMEAIAVVFNDGILLIFGDVLKIIIMLISMYMVNVKLTLLSIISFPLMYFITVWFSKALKRNFHSERLYSGELNTFLQEKINALPIIEVLDRKPKEYHLFRSINTKLMHSHFKGIFYFSLFFPLVEVVAALILASLIIYSLWNALYIGKISQGEIIAFIFFNYMLFQPLRHIADRFNTLQRGLSGADRIFSMLNLDKDFSEKNQKDIIYIKKIEGTISFKDVDFSYDKIHPILKKISFEIKKGSRVALVGPTGSGKSTITKLMTKIYTPTNGSIYIDNYPIKKIGTAQLRSHIRLLHQDTFLFSSTIFNNIQLGDSTITLDFIKSCAKKMGIDPFIESLPGKYNFLLEERGRNLSSGQRQLISLLRAQVSSYSLLILDEATSSVDKNLEDLIYKAMDELINERTSIVIAHRLSTVERADNILVLDKGEIIAEGKHKDLLATSKLYRNLYGL